MRPPRRLLLLVLLLSVGCHSEGKRLAGVNNFAVVDPGAVYRGAQPTAEGIQTLQSRGVRTIINLRDDPVRSEKSSVEAAGMTYVHIPTNAGRIEPEKIRQALESMRTLPRPIFVHCAVGCDRTGLEIAMYRIVIEKWERADAIRELYAHGYHWVLYPQIARYLKAFELKTYLPGTRS